MSECVLFFPGLSYPRSLLNFHSASWSYCNVCGYCFIIIIIIICVCVCLLVCVCVNVCVCVYAREMCLHFVLHYFFHSLSLKTTSLYISPSFSSLQNPLKSFISKRQKRSEPPVGISCLSTPSSEPFFVCFYSHLISHHHSFGIMHGNLCVVNTLSALIFIYMFDGSDEKDFYYRTCDQHV